MRLSRKPQGFTLVELVVVMAVLGILSLGVVFFISDASRGYVSVQDRETLAMRGRHTLERISRALRGALPGSIRISGNCLEYIPIVDGAYYLDLPLASPANSFKAIPPAGGSVDGLRVAVAPTHAAYVLGSPGEVSTPVVVSAVDASGEVTVNFAAPHQFVRESSAKRFYWVQEPVSYCLDGADLWRYQDYGFWAVQLTPAGLPTTLPGRSLASESAQIDFSITATSLQQNAVVDISLQLAEGATQFASTATVQVHNVP
jgi:MSHA biogenesis protein MshO